MCSTKALLAGDGEIIETIYRQRIQELGVPPRLWGWTAAYGEAS